MTIDQFRERMATGESDTYQFNDYSKYAFTYFSEEDKRRYRDEHFPVDLQHAHDLGKRLVEEAKAQ